MKHIVIADAHKSYRLGLQTMLETLPQYRVVDSAADGAEALKAVQQHKPDILLTELHLPVLDGCELIGLLQRKPRPPRILVITHVGSAETVLKTARAGAAGILCKTFSETDLEQALQGVLQGPFYIGHDCASIKETSGKNKTDLHHRQPALLLTDREITVLKLIAAEKSSDSIGKELHLSTRTIEGIRKKMMEKTHTNSTIGLLRYAVKTGVIDL